MIRRRRVFQAVAVAGAVLLAACQREPAATSAPLAAAVDAAALERAAQQIASPAWLRERLPEHTVAYARIPSFFGMLSAPNGRALDAALAAEQHTRLIAQLRDAARKDPLLKETGAGPALGLFLGDQTAPLEIAAIDGSDILNQSTYVLATTRLDVPDVAALNQRLADLGGAQPILKAPLDANGRGEFAKSGFVYFDAAQHRVYALFGMLATAAQLDLYLKQLATPRPHAMFDTERGIDASGQGLFVWISLKGVTGMASANLPASRPGTLLRDFLDKTRAVAFGWGTVAGHGRLHYVVDAPEARLLKYLAPPKFDTDLKTAGTPRWAATIALPQAEQMAQLEANLAQEVAPEASVVYGAGMSRMREYTGMNLAEALRLVGPELLFFGDANGHYAALRVPDAKALYARIDELGKRYHWRHETGASGRATVHHLYIPGLDLSSTAAADPKAKAWMEVYRRIGAHYYWMEEGNYFIFSSVPQALADRAAATLDTSLGTWLRQHQNYDPGATLMGVTLATDHLQREVYYGYLGLLQILGDALGQPVDLLALPSANTLKLPADGALSARFDLTGDRVGLSLGYESTPLEVFAGGGTATAATVAILAAIAIPAYQDYTIRAQVAGTLVAASALKTAVAEYYAQNGRLPSGPDDVEMPDLSGSDQYLESYTIEDGAIVLVYGDQANAQVSGKHLVLVPYRGAGDALLWVCGNAAPPAGAKPLARPQTSSDLPAKYLPGACR